MKHRILHLFAGLIVGALLPLLTLAQAPAIAGLTYVDGPYYINNGHNTTEYLYASGNYVYGNGNYTPSGDGSDSNYVWYIYQNGEYYYLYNAGTGTMMNTQAFADYLNNNGNNNSLNAKEWDSNTEIFYRFTLPSYGTGNSFTTQIVEQRGEYGNRPLHNGFDTGTFSTDNTTNKVYFTDNNYGWGTKNWTFTKAAVSLGITPSYGCWNGAANNRTGGRNVTLTWNISGTYNITGDLGNATVDNTVTSRTFSNVATGTYSVTITDANDASKTATTTVTVTGSAGNDDNCPKTALKLNMDGCYDSRTETAKVILKWNDAGLSNYTIQEVKLDNSGNVTGTPTTVMNITNGSTEYEFSPSNATHYYRVIDPNGEDYVTNSNVLKVNATENGLVSCSPEKIAVSLNQSLCMGQSGTLAKAKVYPSAASQEVAWSISGSGATINPSTGELTTTGTGTVTITATSTEDPTITGELSVTVKSAAACGESDTKEQVGSMTITNSASDVGASCLGETVDITISNSATGGSYVWYVYDEATFEWKKESDLGEAYRNPAKDQGGGRYTLMADNKRHAVQYEDDSGNVLARATEFSLTAAPCCTVDENGKSTGTIMYEEHFNSSTLSDGITLGNYSKGNGTQIGDGQYNLVTGTNGEWTGNWSNISENTKNGGYMLLINAFPKTGATEEDKAAGRTLAFKTSVNSPCENATVDFSSYFTNVCGGGACGEAIQLTYGIIGYDKAGNAEVVDASALNSAQIPSSEAGVWKNARTSFSTQEFENFEIYIYARLGESDAGNDFAIDDIVITACAPKVFLYAAPDTYEVNKTVCEDEVIKLVPKSPVDLTELYNPLYYMLQKYNEASKRWEPVEYTVGGEAITDVNGITNPHNNPIPEFGIDTADLEAGEHQYRVVAGNSYDAVLEYGNGGKPDATECQLYTATNVSVITKSTLEMENTLAQQGCIGEPMTLETEADTPWGEFEEWSWHEGDKNGETLCSSADKKTCIIDTETAGKATAKMDITLENNTPKTYTFVAKDKYGCEASTTITASASPVPTYCATEDRTICNGDEAVITVTITDGVAPYSLVFEGETVSGITASPWTRTVNPSSTTEYHITKVKDSLCGKNGIKPKCD